MEDLSWKKLRSEVQKIGFKKITKKYYEMPDGQEAEFITWGVEGSHNAATIALMSDNQVVIARQYRPGPDSIMDELPGGGVESGEDLAAAAARELLEETGYASDKPFIELGVARISAYHNDTQHYYLATDCYKVSEQSLDSNEHVAITLITVDELISNAKTGKMSDAPAVLMAYEKLRGLLVKS